MYILFVVFSLFLLLFAMLFVFFVCRLRETKTLYETMNSATSFAINDA